MKEFNKDFNWSQAWRNKAHEIYIKYNYSIYYSFIINYHIYKKSDQKIIRLQEMRTKTFEQDFGY